MDYTEARRHELRKRRLLMVDGNLTLNSQTTDAGASARTYQGGYWGFASANDTSAASIERMKAQAARNAAAMAQNTLFDWSRHLTTKVARLGSLLLPGP